MTGSVTLINDMLEPTFQEFRQTLAEHGLCCDTCGLPCTQHGRGWYCQTCERWALVWGESE